MNPKSAFNEAACAFHRAFKLFYLCREFTAVVQAGRTLASEHCDGLFEQQSGIPYRLGRGCKEQLANLLEPSIDVQQSRSGDDVRMTHDIPRFGRIGGRRLPRFRREQFPEELNQLVHGTPPQAWIFTTSSQASHDLAEHID